MSAAMERSSSLRPPRPTRSVPDAPLPIQTSDLPSSPESDDVRFATPLASPLVESPVHEDAPAHPQPTDPQTSSSATASSSDTSALTPIRAHYLKKELVHLEFQRELDALVTAPTNGVSPFSYLGQPFTPPPKGAPPQDLPFLRFFFRRFVLSFPFLLCSFPFPFLRSFIFSFLLPFLLSFFLSLLLSSSFPHSLYTRCRPLPEDLTQPRHK